MDTGCLAIPVSLRTRLATVNARRRSASRTGPSEPACTAVIKTPETFMRLMRDPSPGNFAEAYVESAIDLEGDLYSAMEVANAVEGIHLSPLRKLRLMLSLWKG